MSHTQYEAELGQVVGDKHWIKVRVKGGNSFALTTYDPETGKIDGTSEDLWFYPEVGTVFKTQSAWTFAAENQINKSEIENMTALSGATSRQQICVLHTYLLNRGTGVAKIPRWGGDRGQHSEERDLTMADLILCDQAEANVQPGPVATDADEARAVDHSEMVSDPRFAASSLTVVKLTGTGWTRVLNGKEGMTFIVDKFTPAANGGMIAHVRDYRWTNGGFPFQIWSLSPDQYEVIES
jgi:hypothetical protein